MPSPEIAAPCLAELISLIVVYCVPVITFRSFAYPFTILFSLPLAVIGAAILLWVTHRVVGLPMLDARFHVDSTGSPQVLHINVVLSVDRSGSLWIARSTAFLPDLVFCQEQTAAH